MPDTVLYFARGRGRGHALAALAIADRLVDLIPELEVRFVSYGSGAEVMRDRGRPVLDLGLPDQPDVFAMENRLPRAFATGSTPSIVVAHEEFDVPIAARHRRLPCVVVTDWFLNDPDDWRMESLTHAEEVLFLDEGAGIFPEPEYVEHKVRYVGPVLRPLRYARSDRLRARQAGGFPRDALLVSVLIWPGRRAESIAPLAALLNQAFELLEVAPGIDKLLVWNRDGDSEFDRTMAACDLAITKGNRNLVLELAAMGVPAVSVSHGLNVIDDIRTARLPNNVTVAYRDLNAPALARLMTRMITLEVKPSRFRDGAAHVAERLAGLLQRRKR